MSSAAANEAALIFNAALILLLAASLLAVIRMPPWTGSTADDNSGPLPGPEPPPIASADPRPPRVRYPPGAAPLPVRAPGRSGWIAPAAAGQVPPPDGSWRPRVSGGPPWDPAPRPPGV